MSLHDDERFDSIETRLEAERPRLDAHELDRLSLRVRARGTRSLQTKGEPMRSRFAITAMLVLGLMLSTTGVGLAISGSSGSGSAGNAQYPTTPTTPVSPPAGGNEQGGGGGGVLGGAEESAPPKADNAPAQESTPPPAVQATRQLTTESGSDELPFTGFAVIPILVAGVALLLGGLFLRRRGPSQT